MSKLVPPHGSQKLKLLLLKGAELKDAKAKAEKLPHVTMTTRETSDLIMMAIGAFTPLDGFMTQADWKGVCTDYKMANKLFWPIPITLSVDKSQADSFKTGSEIALKDEETGELMGSMKIADKYALSKKDKEFECEHIFRTTDPEHPGVAKVMEQKEVNLGGTVKVFSESYYPEQFKGLYMRPEESRKIFEAKGWHTIAALQLRNPMHRSHEYLAKIAVEVCDGLFIHQLVGKLKAGDIPADVRVNCINALVENYFVKDTVVTGGYPMEMRYAGPREALLHAVFRQNFGCSHLIVGRDHAGVGSYYGPFDAQKIFLEIPKDALMLKPLNIDWTFYCFKCRGMASMRTCPHGKEDRLLLSGTVLRKTLSEGGNPPEDFSRPEVLKLLKEYYANLDEKVEIKLHKHATGEADTKK
ncbi:MAG: sulfate adenylyltransferase [Candidatus Schekmanbacteria bacterium RBG_13_48_7]|uniref:Sulfate adenylyltransferase n=1 Tax=Candidatus Schekmanbacteria bacterium RBG_13_48_7 TaxID=1817878 RepID=A0A1F7RYM8_9BACT|nr:MAG: sulfate adenylyltransferase [Candidatus Schekmanbacteria bacterium RBG_13_48_7]